MAIRKSFKKISAVCALAGLGISAFAVDIKANIRMTGGLFCVDKNEASGDKEYSYFYNEPTQQIDNPGDGLILEVDNGNAGAHLAMWYRTATASAENEWAAYFRRTYVWFKPIDMLKLQVGYVGCDKHFKEKIDEWKVGSPFAVTERDWSKHPAYINCNDVEGWGFGFEVNPIEPLFINAGITPGKQGHVTSENKEDTSCIYGKENDGKQIKIAPYGFGARYYWDKFEFQASFRDGGMSGNDWTWRVARFGAGYTDESTYAFIQPILGFDYNAADQKWEMNGMCFDLYGEYNWNSFKFYAHAPITIRWGDADTDKNYMEFNFKAEYNTGSHGNLDDVKPYIQLGSNQDDAAWGNTVTRVWLLDKHFKDSFNLTYKAGVDFMISGLEIDIGAKIDQLSEYHKTAYGHSYIVSVPFTLKFKNF